MYYIQNCTIYLTAMKSNKNINILEMNIRKKWKVVDNVKNNNKGIHGKC